MFSFLKRSLLSAVFLFCFINIATAASIDVYVHNVNGSVVSGAKVILYPVFQTLYTDANGYVRFYGLDYGSFTYEVYYDGTGEEEFWGGEDISLQEPLVTRDFTRNWPYKYDDTLPADPYVGETVTMTVTVRNNLSFSRNVKVELWVDRSMTSDWDYHSISNAQSISGGGNTKTFTFDDLTPSNSGTYYYKAHVLSWNDGAGDYIVTDTTNWEIAFTANYQTSTVDVDLLSTTFKEVYRHNDTIYVSVKLRNNADIDLNDVYLHIDFSNPEGLSVVGPFPSPTFNISANSTYTTPSWAYWTIPSSSLTAPSGAYEPTIYLRDSLDQELEEFTPYKTNSIVPILAIGNFPKLDNLIVKTQEHACIGNPPLQTPCLSANDPTTVQPFLQKFVDAGFNSISMSVKLEDPWYIPNYQSCDPNYPEFAIIGQVLFDSSNASPGAHNPLSYDLYKEAQLAAESINTFNINPWVPTFYDHAQSKCDHPSEPPQGWHLTPDPHNEYYVDPFLNEVRNYEASLISELMDTDKYNAPNRLTIDHFRFLNTGQYDEQERTSKITSFVQYLDQIIPQGIKLSGYMWPPIEKVWTGQDYSQLDPFLDVFSPMLYWQACPLLENCEISSTDNLSSAVRQYIYTEIAHMKNILGSVDKIIPTISMANGVDYSNGTHETIDPLKWRKAQLNILGILADEGIEKYDLFLPGNWFNANSFGEEHLDLAYYLADLSEYVDFPDPNLKAAIRGAIGKPTGDIYERDLVGLTSLHAGSANISDLTGLEYCVDLNNLNLRANQISNINPLSGLTNLGTLILQYNQINEISALAGLINLASLSLDHNQISEISALAGLTNLTNLYLHSNQIIEIGALSSLSNLTYLDLRMNQISEISALSSLSNLNTLILQINQISEISALAGLTNLGTLSLQYNQIRVISALAGLTNLTYLYLDHNEISEINALITNMGINAGDYIDLRTNPLNCTPIQNDLPILIGRGVNVHWNYNDTDMDSDGILDGDEDSNENGQLDENETDPCNPDTDLDGMTDGWEVTQNTNPRVDDAFFDNDNDSYSNLREYLSNTNPWNDQDIPTLIADFIFNNAVDGMDLALLVEEYGRDDCSIVDPCNCDLNFDASVEEIDLFLFAEDFGRIE